MTTSTVSPTPTGEDAPAAGTHRALKQDEATTQGLLQAVLSRDNRARAWKRVKANKGPPGIDGVTVEDWPAHAREHWPALREQIGPAGHRPNAHADFRSDVFGSELRLPTMPQCTRR